MTCENKLSALARSGWVVDALSEAKWYGSGTLRASCGCVDLSKAVEAALPIGGLFKHCNLLIACFRASSLSVAGYLPVWQTQQDVYLYVILTLQLNLR